MQQRRSTRANLKGLQVMRFRVGARRQLLRAAPLNEYMSSANIRFTKVVDENAELRANLAHFASHTFAHVFLPRASVEWPRDSETGGRCLVLVVEGSGFTVQADEQVIQRERGLFFIPPGAGVVRFEAASPAELLFVSCDISLLPGIPVQSAGEPEATPIDPSQLRPLTSFIKALCSITTGADEGSAEPLSAAGREVTRSLIAMVVGTSADKPDLFNHAIRTIVQNFANGEVSIRWVAKELHASTRTLQAAFTTNGTTFSRELRMVRLKAASELRRRDSKLSVADAARAVGFGSTSAFYRASHDLSS